MTPQTFTCSRCGQEHPLHRRYDFGNETLCPDCLEESTVLCSHCGERIWLDDNDGTGDTPLCCDCRERHYNYCSHCGRLIHWDNTFFLSSDEDDENPLCQDCHTQLDRECAIRDYFYKPTPVFYGQGPRFFGVELEIDEGGENSIHAQRIMDIGNAEHEHIYCKHDGSLDDGFEIVTHPMSLTYQVETMPWTDILSKATSMGYTSHQARTCGLHVHVSRNAFGSNETAQDNSIARVLYFFEKHWEELLKFSRRTETQLKRWAARYGYKEHPMEILDNAKRGYGGGRYSSVNLQNADTVEFRMFRGTLKLNTLLATLQLVNRVCDVAIFMSDDEVKALSWTSFVSSIDTKGNPQLVQYLKERRLYVNEPVVESEAEV